MVGKWLKCKEGGFTKCTIVMHVQKKKSTAIVSVGHTGPVCSRNGLFINIPVLRMRFSYFALFEQKTHHFGNQFFKLPNFLVVNSVAKIEPNIDIVMDDI